MPVAAWSTTRIASGSPRCSTTNPRTSSRTLSASQLARASKSCIPCGLDSPTCSAIVQQFFRGRSDIRPSTNNRARRRGSTRANRPATRPIRSSNINCQRSMSTLWLAATSRSRSVHTTDHDHEVAVSVFRTPQQPRSRSPAGVLDEFSATAQFGDRHGARCHLPRLDGAKVGDGDRRTPVRRCPARRCPGPDHLTRPRTRSPVEASHHEYRGDGGNYRKHNVGPRFWHVEHRGDETRDQPYHHQTYYRRSLRPISQHEDRPSFYPVS